LALIFVIDTSSARSAAAVLEPDGTVVYEEVAESGATFDLPTKYRALHDGPALTRVAVATGPGSFTGLRVGVSFGLGLAFGLRIPIMPLPTLALQAARSDGPVTAVSEAGRGRVYYLSPEEVMALAEPADLPKTWPVIGWLRPGTQAALEAAGLQMKPEEDLRTFGTAAFRLLESAPEVAYGSLKLEYMQSFSARL
jgi:tRNA threonylcarbamoyl adenosine modification protein YeaZ